MASYGRYLATVRTSAFQIITRPLFHLSIRCYTRFLSPSYPDHLRRPRDPGSTNFIFRQKLIFRPPQILILEYPTQQTQYRADVKLQ